MFRRPLFRESAVLPHTVGKGEAAFDWRAQKVEDEAGDTVCEQQIFIEPVAWMQDYVLQLEGKVECELWPLLNTIKLQVLFKIW